MRHSYVTDEHVQHASMITARGPPNHAQPYLAMACSVHGLATNKVPMLSRSLYTCQNMLSYETRMPQIRVRLTRVHTEPEQAFEATYALYDGNPVTNLLMELATFAHRLDSILMVCWHNLKCSLQP